MTDTTLYPPKTVRYRVRIVGHAAPYRWTVERFFSGIANPVTPANCSGESETYEGAQFDAAEAARQSEWERLHQATQRYEELFEVPADPEPSDF